MRYREVERKLLAAGFFKRQGKGSHVIFRHPDGRTTTAPDHGRKDLGAGLLAKIQRDTQIELNQDE